MLALTITPETIYAVLGLLAIAAGVVARLTKGKHDTVAAVAQALVDELVDNPHGAEILGNARRRASIEGVDDHFDRLVDKAVSQAPPASPTPPPTS